MRHSLLRLALGFGLAAATAAPSLAEGATVDVGGLHLRVQQPDPLTLVLDYTMGPPLAVEKMSGRINGVSLGEPDRSPFPADNQTAAILFLVDTSASSSRRVLDAAKRDAAAMMARAKPHHRLGLASFDSELAIRAEIGSPPETLRQSLMQLRPAGQRTELFRRGAEAVLTLDAATANRKAMYIFSDGRAEDDPKAYPLSYLADTAVTAGVRINGYCYSGIEPPPISCQNLARLAELTGGVYVAASRAPALPTEILEAPFAGIDNGGRAIFSLSAAAEAGIGGNRDVRLLAEFSGGRSIVAAVPVILPDVPLLDRMWAPQSLPWTVAGIAAVLATVALVLYVLFRLAGDRRAKAAQRRPIAYIEFLDGRSTRFPMTSAALRIGRGTNNDVRLANTSISANHAEINRKRDGSFIITDLDSTNGVVVNDSMVDRTELRHGDRIELGEVRFRFALPDVEPVLPSEPEYDHPSDPGASADLGAPLAGRHVDGKTGEP